MKTIKTSELDGNALDWAVAQCAGVPVHILSSRLLKAVYHNEYGAGRFQPSKKWEHAGPIIEREGIEIHRRSDPVDSWSAFGSHQVYGIGPTPIVAAMRCYVAGRLGDEVQVPEELA